jgi:hypothetical protein
MNNKKALFLHISKTGGSSIGCAPFVLLYGTPDVSPETAVKDIESIKFSFTFVRNPITRFSSAVLNHGYATPENFEEWVTGEFLENFYNKWTFMKEWQELMPQYKYVYHDDKKVVDFIGRFENIKSDWHRVCAMAGEYFELPHKNKNKFPDHVKCHTGETIEVVRKVYQKDFEYFNYEYFNY